MFSAKPQQPHGSWDNNETGGIATGRRRELKADNKWTCAALPEWLYREFKKHGAGQSLLKFIHNLSIRLGKEGKLLLLKNSWFFGRLLFSWQTCGINIFSWNHLLCIFWAVAVGCNLSFHCPQLLCASCFINWFLNNSDSPRISTHKSATSVTATNLSDGELQTRRTQVKSGRVGVELLRPLIWHLYWQCPAHSAADSISYSALALRCLSNACNPTNHKGL